MAKQLLPNGSVVTLKGATKKLMTIGVEVEMEGDEKTYDYIAVPYPEGYIDSETMFLFMQEDIENVFFVGFVDAEMQVFRTALEETDENDAEKTLNAYNALKDWGMNVLVGTVTSTPCVAVANETAADNMFQLTPSGSATECVANPNVFRVCFSDPNQGTAAAQYIGEHKLATKVAIIYDSSDVYSSGITQNFTAEAANQGIEIVSSEAFTADNNKDFSVQLQKAKDGGAELVFLPIYYTEASLILAQADSMGFETKFFGCDGMDGILGVENFDTSLAEGLMLLTPFAADSTDEKTQNFVKAYKDAYKDTPNQFAADAYDAVYAVKAAAEKEDVKADMDVADICAALEKGMTEITLEGVTGDEITWTEDGEPNKAPKAVEIKDGAYAAME